jgi:serine/threonine-protein kinase
VIAGRYRLLEPLGKGAMGAVWLAEDLELGRRVAIKALGAKADRERFDREARAAAALSNPHICQLFDFGEAGNRPYMVLEYLPGGTLEDRLAGGAPLPDGETQRIATEIAAALAHAHSRGVVHRDLKPANVLFDVEGRAKIADFGIARMSGGGTLTETGTVLGTASYISPEQAAGLAATAASDVYSFAVIVFRMLTGRLPFRAKNAMEVVRMHRDDPPPALLEIRPDAPAGLAALVDSALVKDPLQRPADGRALIAALQGGNEETATAVLAPAASPEAATAATMVLPRTAPPPADRPRRAARSWLPLALGVLALVLVAGVVLAFVVTGGDGGNPAAPPPTLNLPPVPTTDTGSTVPSTTPAATTEPESVESTVAPTTTEQATTTAPTTTTRPTTTAPTTTAPPVIPSTPIVTTAPETTPTTPTTPATTVAATVTTPTVTTPETITTPTVPVPGGGG